MKIDIDLRDILVSHILLTRLPLPTLPDKCFARQSKATWAFPLVGVSVAAIAALIAQGVALLGLPAPLVAGVALMVLIVITGAMHEDGLADVADGFWGGFERSRRLEIMKDSHIGTYGVLALIMVNVMRWSALSSLVHQTGPAALWALLPVAAVSRAALPVLMWKLPDARPSGLSRSVGQPGYASIIAAIVIAFGCAVIAFGTVTALLLCALSALVILALALLALRKIGGKTGDVLGAAQQLTELTCLLALVALS